MIAFRLLRSLLIVGALGATLSAQAGLIGSRVTGSMTHLGGVNYFDPTVGYAASGCLNATQGTTVTVEDPAVEFGYDDHVFNAFSMDITDTLITLRNNSYDSVPLMDFSLTSAAFAGLEFTKTSDDFNAGGTTFARSGNTLVISIPYSLVVGDFHATFAASPAPVPEPASLGALGLGAVALLRRRGR